MIGNPVFRHGEHTNRRFYINHAYRGCNYDETWMGINDLQPAACSWETGVSPVLFYSPETAYTMVTGK